MPISILRSLGAVLLGLATALLLVILVEVISGVLHPFPPNFDGTQEAMFAHVANYPAWVLALLGGVGWSITIVVCTWLATRLGTHRHPAHGFAVGLILLSAASFNIFMLPYPLWFVLLDGVALPLGAYCGTRLGAGASKG